jgi:hypothetical protein
MNTSTAAGRKTRITIQDTLRMTNTVLAGSAALLVRMPKN